MRTHFQPKLEKLLKMVLFVFLILVVITNNKQSEVLKQ